MIRGKFIRWENGWLFRRVFKQKFERLRVAEEEAAARRAELEQQEDLARLRTQIEMPQRVSRAFHRVCDGFTLVAGSSRIWDTVAYRNANRIVE